MIIHTAANESHLYALKKASLSLKMLKNASIGTIKELALDQMMLRNWVSLSSLVNLELVVIVITAFEKSIKLVKCATEIWHLGLTGSSSLSMTSLPLQATDLNKDFIDLMELYRLKKLGLSPEPTSKQVKVLSLVKPLSLTQ